MDLTPAISREEEIIKYAQAYWSYSGPTREVNFMARDPVCGMEVDEKKAAAISVYRGKTYYFCTQACKRAFGKDPAKYIES